jgi:hypothetical protein
LEISRISSRSREAWAEDLAVSDWPTAVRTADADGAAAKSVDPERINAAAGAHNNDRTLTERMFIILLESN